MKSMLNLVFILLATVSFCQNDLTAEIQTLESEIMNLSSEINKLKSQRDEELNAQQGLIDEKSKQKIQQQQIVDNLSVEINDLKTKISSYGVNQNQISAYKELSDKELYVVRTPDKKLTKFRESIKESNTILYSDYRMVYSTNTLYILNNKGRARFQKIEFSEKQQKQFDKLTTKEILLPIGAVKASYLKKETGLDEQYFDLHKNKKKKDLLMSEEKQKNEILKKEKDDLINTYEVIELEWNVDIDPKLSSITRKYDRLNEINLEIERNQKLAEIEKLKNELELNSCKIGNQSWMSKNLKFDHFLNGDKIKEVQSVEEFDNLTNRKTPCFLDPMKMSKNASSNQGFRSVWDKDKTHDEHKDIGYIYNHYCIYDSRGLAPEGWRIPDVEDCWDLLKYCARKELSYLDFTNEQDYNPIYQSVYCNKCKDWNSEYRSKKACDACKDNRVVGEKRLYRTNKTKFSHLRSQYTDDYFVLATDENYKFNILYIPGIGQEWNGINHQFWIRSYASRRDTKRGTDSNLKKKGFIRLIKD